MIMKILCTLLLLFSLYINAEEIPIPNWKMLESMDSDKNNLISKEEFLSSQKIFKSIDTNQDELLSLHELKEARKSTPPSPKVGEKVPDLQAYNPLTGKMVKLSNRTRPFALIFGTHT